MLPVAAASPRGGTGSPVPPTAAAASVDEITGESAKLVMKGDDVTPTITRATRRVRNGAVKRLAISFGCVSPS